MCDPSLPTEYHRSRLSFQISYCTQHIAALPVSSCQLISWLKSSPLSLKRSFLKTQRSYHITLRGHDDNWLDRCLDQRSGKIILKDRHHLLLSWAIFLSWSIMRPLLHLHVTIPSWAAENALSPTDPVKFSLVMHFGSRLTIVLGGQVAHNHQNMNGWPSFVGTRHRKWFLKVIVCVGYQADSHRSIGCDH